MPVIVIKSEMRSCLLFGITEVAAEYASVFPRINRDSR
jgi:hypothetical protein